jgi:hypothetical protein
VEGELTAPAISILATLWRATNVVRSEPLRLLWSKRAAG